MAIDIESLNVKIESDSSQATTSLDALIRTLERLNNVSLDRFIKNFQQVVKVPSKFDEEAERMAASVARKFRLTGEVAREFSTELATAIKAVNGGGYDYGAIERASTVLQKNGEVVEKGSDAWRELRDYVSKSAGAISAASATAADFPDMAKRMTQVLGSGWSFAKGNAGKDLSEFVMEMDGVLGTNFWERSGESSTTALQLIVEELEKGKDQVRSFANDSDYMADRFGSAVDVVKNTVGDMWQTLAENPSMGVSSEQVLNPLASALKAMQGAAGTTSTQSIDRISDSLNTLSAAVQKTDISSFSEKIVPFVTALNGLQVNPDVVKNLVSVGYSFDKLSNAKVPAGLFDGIQKLAETMNGTAISSESLASLERLATAIAALAGKTQKRYETSFVALADGLDRLFQVLARAPTINPGTVQTLQAIGSISTDSVRAAKGMMRMGDSASRGAKGLFGFATNAHRTAVSAHSLSTRLAFTIGKFRQIYFLVRRMASGFGNMVESAMDYVETLNYFNAAFDQVASRSEDAFAKAGTESGEAFVNRFAQEAEKLTEKMSGYAVGADGMVRNTGMTTLGLNPERMMNYQATFAQMASSMGVSSDVATDLSRALTEIGADLASVKNMSFEQTWENLQSGLVGMSRAVDKYGLNIRNVNLQQKLTSLGIEANIQEMNQQDKALLRTIIILENSQYAWGDLADTLQQPANQLRMLQSGVQNLGRTLGNLFLPIVARVLPYVNALVVALQRMIESLIALVGIDFDWGSAGGAAGINSEWADYLDDTAEGFGAATEAAEEWKNEILGFDEINKLGSESSDDSSSSGSGSNPLITGQLEGALKKALDEYQRVWDASYANVDNQVNELAQRIIDAFKEGDFENLGKKASEWIVKGLNKINWNDVKEFAYDVGANFADFLNGFMTPDLFGTVGRTVAEALNAAVQKALGFATRLDWINVGESFAAGLSEFLTTFDFVGLVDALNKFVRGFAIAFTAALKKMRWGEIISNVIDGALALDPLTLAIIIGSLSFKSVGSSVAGMASTIVKGIGEALAGTSLGFALGAGGIIALTVGVQLAFEKANIQNIMEDTMPYTMALSGISDGFETVLSNAEKLANDANFKGEWLSGVAERYKELNKKIDLTGTEEQELRDLAQILAGENPAFISLIDDQTGAWKGTYDQLDSLVRKTREYYLVAAAENAKSAYYAQAMEAEVGLAGAESEYNAARQEWQRLNAEYLALATKYSNEAAAAGKEFRVEDYADLARLGEQMARQMSIQQDANKRIQEFRTELSEAETAMEKYDSYIAEMTLQAAGLADAVVNATKTINDTDFSKWVDSAAKAIDGVGGYWVKGTNGMVQVSGDTSLRIYQAIMNGDLKKVGPGMYQTALGDVIYYGNGLTAGEKSAPFVSALKTLGASGPGFMRLFYKDWKESGYQSANHTASGIKKGVADNMKSVETAGRSMAHAGFLKGFDEEMLIKSPSRAMQQRGVYIVQGLAKGLADTSSLTNPLAQLRNAITSAFSYNNIKSGLGGVISAFSDTFGEASNAAIGQYNSMASKMSAATVNGKKAMALSQVPMLKYANGGYPEDGMFFLANHHELIGQFSNGRTAVANNEQIIAGIEGGVARGMAQALMSSASVTGGQNGQPVQVVINVDSETLYRTTLRGQNKYNSRYHLQLG